MTPASARQWSFADLEVFPQRAQLDPLLEAISQFIEPHGALVEAVRGDATRSEEFEHGTQRAQR